MKIDDDLNDDQKKALYKNDCFLFAANSIILYFGHGFVVSTR